MNPHLAATHTLLRPKVDLEALTADLDDLKNKIKADVGPEDLAHLRRMERWGWMLGAAGLAIAWIAPNPLSPLLIGLARFHRWAMMAHHVMHRGYDRVPGVPPRFTSKHFARGWRRWVDWFDWMVPEAWDYEHNLQHHYRLGEWADPDQPELNIGFLGKAGVPKPAIYLFVAAFAATWKILYYTPNTLGQLHQKDNGGHSEEGRRFPFSWWLPTSVVGRQVWLRSWLPNAIFWFGLVPLPFLLIGWWAWLSVLINLVLAEAVTNAWGFVVIASNHAGDDLYRFEEPMKDKGEFYLRQIVGSVNFACGSDGVDFAHGWLNYQIEHHLWPDMTMLQYRRAQPEVKAICAKHGVPYVHESVWIRLRKLVDVLVGNTTMPVWEGTPEA